MKKLDKCSMLLVISRLVCLIMACIFLPVIIKTGETGSVWYLWAYIIVASILVPVNVGLEIYVDEQKKEA